MRYDANKHQLNIAMSGWGMFDHDVEKWCSWFRLFMDRLPTGGRRNEQIWAHEVNFAENRLTSAGVRCLLETLTKCKVAVLTLKLHHNQLSDGASVAEFIVNSQGVLRELHLSHNELETAAAAEIVLAAASAADPNGNFCYPSRVGHSASPLWLRLEQNYVDATALSQRTDPEFEQLRPGKVLCNVSSRACTPHCCVKHRHDPPPVHAKHLSNQRNKAAVANSSAAGQDLLTMLKSGKREEGRDGDRSEGGDRLKESAAGQEQTDATEGVFADVLRWDDEEHRWVRDVIEIPELPKETAEETGRVKLSQEVGDKLGNELKCMIGGSKRSEGKSHDERKPPSTPETKRFSRSLLSSPATDSSGFELDSLGAESERTSAQDEEQIRSPASRRSRRGSQPFGSEVKQVNGFTLNPQAKEFFPVASAPGHKLVEISLPALNPEAEEFKPNAATQQLLAAKLDETLVDVLGTVPPMPLGMATDVASEDSTAVDAISAPETQADDVAPVHSEEEPTGTTGILAPSDKIVEMREPENLDENEWSIGKAFYSAFSAASAAVGFGSATGRAKSQSSK